MGFFSWETNDTKKSIPSCHSVRPVVPVYLIDNQGNSWFEPAYEGYGVFAGMRYYDLLAQMNDYQGDGLDLAYENHIKQKDILHPNLVEDPKAKWVNKPPKDCPAQGYFYEGI